MQNDFDFSAYDGKIRARFTEELQRGRDASALCRAMAGVVSTAEETLAARIEPGEVQHIACRAGCGTCCVVNVSVLFSEAVAIAGYVRREFSGEQLLRLKERIDGLYADSRWLDEEERLFLRRPCAFLDAAQACVIYPVRPLLCRSVTSTDPEDCRRAVALPALSDTGEVLMNLFQKTLMETTFEAVGKALEGLGFDARGVRLTEALKALLEKGELARDFVTGRRLVL